MRRVTLPALLLPLFAVAAGAAELPVTRITLSNAGLIEIVRAGPLAPDAPVTFRAPAADIDDLLKSLLVRDPTGRVEGVRLPALDVEAEAFRGLPLRPEDFAGRVALLRALRGQAVTAGGATGRLLEVEEGERGLRLVLLTEAGMRLLLLPEAEEVRLTDRALAARLARAAAAIAASRAAEEREVEIRITGGGTAPRPVTVSYVAAAPLWKPSWRLVVGDGGQGRLQGWAVVENRSGADWDGVALALVSGSPAAFRQSLYAPIRVDRPEIALRGAPQLRVQADTGARPTPPPPPPPVPQPAPVAAAAPPGAPMASRSLRMEAQAAPAMAPAPPPPPPPPPPVAGLPAAAAESAAGRVAFTLPQPVTLRGGETANLPFLDAALPAETLWWVQDLGARNPLNAVRLRNATDLVLPDGLVAISVGEAWQGDAELRAMAAGEVRLLPFARDRDVQITRADSTTETPARVEFRRAVVVVGTVLRDQVALAVDPRGTRGLMVVDLPRRAGAPRFPVAAEGDFGLRTEVRLDGTATTLRFTWERDGSQQVPLYDAAFGDPVSLAWRDAEIEANLRRLPGGPGGLEALQALLGRLPAGAPGRDRLDGLVRAMVEVRRLLEVARVAIRQHAVADAALDRARAAAEDRTGAARAEARRRLNEASAAAERAGAAADQAWEAWQRAVQEAVARTG